MPQSFFQVKLIDYLSMIFRVKFTMDPFIQKFQPELYEKWIRNLDIDPHPEDSPEMSIVYIFNAAEKDIKVLT